MSEENKDNSNDGLMAETICEDTHAIASETKQLMSEARSSLTILISSILLMSLISIFLSTWLAKTITNTPTSFGTIVSHYFGFDRNGSEQYLTWWTPVHVKPNELLTNNSMIQRDNTTRKPRFFQIPFRDYPTFHTVVLPLLFIGAIVLAVLAYFARIKCTNRDFAWGAVPRIPLGRVDPKVSLATIAKAKEAEPGIDYTIVQGTKDEPVVFAIAETLEPLREEGDVVDEGTQYEPEDLLKVITHVSSAPQLHTENAQTVRLFTEQNHVIEMLQREPLPTRSSSHS